MSNPLSAIALAALIAFSLSYPSFALAQNSSDLITAEALFDAGRRLMQEGKFQEACPKFEESLKIDDGIGTRLRLADCYEKSGRIASAWTQFRQAASSASRQADSRAALAKSKAAALESRLPRLVIDVPSERRLPGLVVSRDGSPVIAEVFGIAVPLDPGPHLIEARAPGKSSFMMNVDIVEGKQQWVTIPAWDSSKPLALPGQKPAAKEVGSGESSSYWVPLSFAGLALVSLSAGTYMGFKAKSHLDDSRDYCNGNVCNETGGALRSDARSAATASSVLFGLGAASGLTATILYLTAPHAPTSQARLRLAPQISTLGGGLLMQGSF